MAAFVDRWKLAPDAEQILKTLDEGVRQVVFSEFDPREDTHDVSGKLASFARSVGNRHAMFGSMHHDIEAFSRKFYLDEHAASWLTSLPAETLHVVLTEFDPKEGTENVIGKMRAFARSVQNRPKRGGFDGHAGHHAPAPAVNLPGGEQLNHRLISFATHWGVDESALDCLRALPLEVQSIVIEEFDPKGDTMNVSGKLLGFARSIAARGGAQAWPRVATGALTPPSHGSHVGSLGGHRGAPAGAHDAGRAPQRRTSSVAVEAFVRQWGMEPWVQEFLDQLPPDVLSEVFQQFDPAPGTQNVGAKLKRFAEGIVSGVGGGAPIHHGQAVSATLGGGGVFSAGGGAMSATHHRRFADSAPSQARHSRNVGDVGFSSASQVSGRYMRNVDRDPKVRAFILRWGLDEVSTPQLLESLPERACSTVLAEFEPRDGTRNVDAKLRAFAGTVAAGVGSPGGASAGGLAGMSASASGLQTDKVAWLRTWGLAEHETAHDVLARLTPVVRERVMAEFAPGTNTQNVLGKFVGFANSVSRAQASSTASGPVFRSAGHSVGPGVAGSGRAHVPQSAGRADAGTMLATKWGLGESSVLEFRAVPVEIQAVVAAEFDPKGAVHNIDGKFCAFLRSVASRAPRGSKRPLGSWDQPGATRQRY